MAGPTNRPGNPGGTPPAPPIPHFVTDPTASLEPRALEVQLGTALLEIPAMTAAQWLQILFTDFDIWDIIPGLCPDQAEQVDEAILDGLVSLTLVRDTALEVITEATGRPWWYVLRLVALVKNSWETIGGELTFRGVRADQLSLGAWLDAVLLVCLRSIKQEDVVMFTSSLESPPPELLLMQREATSTQEDGALPELPDDGLPADMEMDRRSFLALR